MVRSVRWLGVSAMAIVLLGCPKKPGAGDAGADAAPVATATEAEAPAAPTAAANAADVTQYPGQNADNGETITARLTVTTRTETGSTGGKVVAMVKAGTQVQRLADHEGYNLVLFSDPADSTRKLEGWAPQAAFGALPHVVVTDGGLVVPTVSDAGPVAVVDAGPPKPTKPLDVKKVNGACPAGYAACNAMCRLQCTADADCGLSTAKCSGGSCLGPGAAPCSH